MMALQGRAADNEKMLLVYYRGTDGLQRVDVFPEDILSTNSENVNGQMRVVTVGFLLNVIYVFVLFFWAVDAYGKTMAQAMGCGDPKVTWLAGAYAPIVAIVFFVLAHRGIKKDEMKVRAADRLR